MHGAGRPIGARGVCAACLFDDGAGRLRPARFKARVARRRRAPLRGLSTSLLSWRAAFAPRAFLMVARGANRVARRRGAYLPSWRRAYVCIAFIAILTLDARDESNYRQFDSGAT